MLSALPAYMCGRSPTLGQARWKGLDGAVPLEKDVHGGRGLTWALAVFQDHRVWQRLQRDAFSDVRMSSMPVVGRLDGQRDLHHRQ